MKIMHLELASNSQVMLKQALKLKICCVNQPLSNQRFLMLIVKTIIYKASFRGMNPVPLSPISLLSACINLISEVPGPLTLTAEFIKNVSPRYVGFLPASFQVHVLVTH